MRIDALTVPVTAGLLAGALPKVAAPFATTDLHATPADPPPAPAGPAMPSVEMLVTLGMQEPAIDRRRRVARDAARGLDLLDRLHQELLVGTPGVARLQEIAAWASSAETPPDPALAQIFRDVDVRVRVELAKYDIEV